MGAARNVPGLISLAVVTFEVAPEANGDANRDGVTNSFDALEVLQFTAGQGILIDKERIRADVNQDGVVNAIDAQLILQYDAGLIEGLPVGGG